METATLAGGCFWCTEGVFQKIKGVKKIISGYAGGYIEKPSYEQVSSGITNHAESIQIVFDPEVISYKDILYIFFRIHDPTTPNRQGYDVGSQYRSVIFYHNEKQKKEVATAMADAQKEYDRPLVTQVVPFKNFYKAENYHQSYYKKNPNKPYCKLVIDPKIRKLRRDFSKYLKISHSVKTPKR
jgi:peptide-methionine (S)-S-oxide reductase